MMGNGTNGEDAPFDLSVMLRGWDMLTETRAVSYQVEGLSVGDRLLSSTHYDFRVVTSLTGVYTTVQGRETTAQAEKVPQLVDDTVVSDIVTVLTAASVPGPPSIVRR
jgi:hypothetical protein